MKFKIFLVILIILVSKSKGNSHTCGGSECKYADECNYYVGCDESDNCIYEKKYCNDNNPLTFDYCHPYSGCQHETPSCDYGCNDYNSCTEDVCNYFTNTCYHYNQMNCDDNNPCTIDSCSDSSCVHVERTCNDYNMCTIDSCSTKEGGCIHTPINIDDENECTIDFCVPNLGVLHPQKVCGDGKLCIDGSCMSKNETDCSKKSTKCIKFEQSVNGCIEISKCIQTDRCNLVSCDEKTGNCINTLLKCDDGNPNTIDSCDIGVGCLYTTITQTPTQTPTPSQTQTPTQTPTPSPTCFNYCDDGDYCTTDFCDFRGNCNHYFDSSVCELPTLPPPDYNWPWSGPINW